MPKLRREHGFSTASFYKWRSKYGGRDALMISQMRSLENENRRLKHVFAEQRSQHRAKSAACYGISLGLAALFVRTK